MYMFLFYILESSYVMMCVDMLSYRFLCRINPLAVPLSIPCDSAHGEPIFLRMKVKSLRMPFMRVVGLYWDLLCGPFLFGL